MARMSAEAAQRLGTTMLIQHRPPEWRRGRPVHIRCTVCGDPAARLYETRLIECPACGAIRIQQAAAPTSGT